MKTLIVQLINQRRIYFLWTLNCINGYFNKFEFYNFWVFVCFALKAQILNYKKIKRTLQTDILRLCLVNNSEFKNNETSSCAIEIGDEHQLFCLEDKRWAIKRTQFSETETKHRIIRVEPCQSRCRSVKGQNPDDVWVRKFTVLVFRAWHCATLSRAKRFVKDKESSQIALSKIDSRQ